ncbi:amidohydrolase family protein [Bowmanella pacifica]|uniref:Amidohydrolase 3 domain-containing protein n=1 Tax=Bowmanella pacifica TaxID=502051 RepID=A0A918DJJ4_9ALTE|nr:amidohydrolase family protein [Bowmanella pacifica]GGO70226.1 hypothetical protein GCM10010982_23220 [Bowmanella pacifica]
MRYFSNRTLALVATAFLAAGCGKNVSKTPEADTLYFGGAILTMEGDTPQYAEALLVKNGRILFVGKLDEADNIATAKHRIDLAGKTMLPGFIDAHGHIFNTGIQKLSANLLPPPDGEGADVAVIFLYAYLLLGGLASRRNLG